MADVPLVMISSTARDLPEHREEAMDACQRVGMFPIMMEHLPASDADAISESLAMVDRSDIYLGIFAHRYGYIPEGHSISITEMEYNRAVERGIPRLIFIIDRAHPILIDDVEFGPGVEKLRALKERILKENIVQFFKSPADLRAGVIQSLLNTLWGRLDRSRKLVTIPNAPDPYIVGPYTLLQTKDLIGRRAELDLLTSWVRNSRSDVYQAHLLSLLSIGGMGKSALAWTWFNRVAPVEMVPLMGRIWWSFYDTETSMEDFVSRALAYVSKLTTNRADPAEVILCEVGRMPPSDREAELLSILDQYPFLIVLDGLERILVAYACKDPLLFAIDDLSAREPTVDDHDLHAVKPDCGQHRLRRTADPRIGVFLRKLAGVRSARVLITSRLLPSDLQTVTGECIPGVYARSLPGLCDEDALKLWYAMGVGGSSETLLPLFHTFDNHPILIQALAGEIAQYRRAPGNFDIWRRDHPRFDPFTLPLVHVKAHILEFALQGVTAPARGILSLIAALREPVHYNLLVSVLVGQEGRYTDVAGLHIALAELEDRGLLGWNRSANTYALHPVVRGVVWKMLSQSEKKHLLTELYVYFSSKLAETETESQNPERIAHAIELYRVLIGLERYEDAFQLFRGELREPLLYFASSSHERCTELLEGLFPDGVDAPPHLKAPADQEWVMHALALAYDTGGRPGASIPLYRRQIAMRQRRGSSKDLAVSLCNFSSALYQCGKLRESEAAAKQGLLVARNCVAQLEEVANLILLGLVLGTRGLLQEARSALDLALSLARGKGYAQAEVLTDIFLAQMALWARDPSTAKILSDRAWEHLSLAQISWRLKPGFVQAARLQGLSALALGELSVAEEHLHYALTRARAVGAIEEEIHCLIGMAELRQKQGDLTTAREMIDEVWELVEAGPYPMLAADAHNVLALIEREAGNCVEAAKAARNAYRLAWCDGPPFVYYYGMDLARRQLSDLGYGNHDCPLSSPERAR